MKKIILSTILAAGLLSGSVMYAQTDATTGATRQNKECCQTSDNAKVKKGGKKKGNKPQFNPFEGVQLTPDQQQKIQVLQQGLGPVVLSPEPQAKIKENPNLTPEQKKQLKAEKKAKKLEAKKNYLNGVKDVLTPDQYVIFLENCYIYNTPGDGVHSGKHQKKGHKGEKGNKGPKDKKETDK